MSGVLVANHATVYQYCLRVAYLVHLTLPRPAVAVAPVTPGKKDDSWTAALFGLGDSFGKASSAKFPKELPKLLNARLEAIAKGQDRFNQADFRAVVGAFYGSYNNASFQRQLKENRKVEELILTFVTSAQGVLKKRANGTDEWKEALMLHVGTFVSLIREVMASKEIPSRHVSKELLDRMDSYLSRLSMGQSSHTRAESIASVSTVAIDDMQLVRQVGAIFAVEPDQLQRDIATAKKICTEKAALRDLKTCISNVNSGARYPGRREDFDSDDAFHVWRRTELDTLQQMILALAAANRDALASEESAKERAPGSRPISLAFAPSGPQSSLGHGLPSSVSNPANSPISPPHSGGWMHVRAPSLSHRPSHNSGHFDYFVEASREEEELETLSLHQESEGAHSFTSADFPAAGFDFTYIPPDPKAYYSLLLQICLSIDLEGLRDLPPDEEVSLKILSKSNQAILSECAIRWRLSPLTRAVLFVDEIVKRFVADEIPVIECVDEALLELEGLIAQGGNLGWDALILADRQLLAGAQYDMVALVLRRFRDLLQIPSLDAAPEIAGLQRTLSLIAYHPVFREDVMPTQDFAAIIDSFAQAVQDIALRSYQAIRTAVLYKERDGHGYVRALKEALRWFRDMAMVTEKLFPEAVLQSIDVTSIFFATASPMVAEDLAAAQEAIPGLLDGTDTSPEVALEREDDVQQLFDAAREHVDMFETFCPNGTLQLDFKMFEPLVLRWLEATSHKTLDWVNAAVSVDKFLPEGEDHHSSSIVDVIESCNSAVKRLVSFKWPDEVINAFFVTRLSESVAKAIEEYCEQLERLFVAEMFPPTINAKTGMADPETDERTSAWLVRARGLVQTDKKIEPFSFQEATLVKLNNIQAARDLLDKMYTDINVDRISELAAQVLPQPPLATDPTARNLFTIKVVLGEDLVGIDDTQKLNPFLTLSDSSGHRLAKTRTLYKTTNPRWGEVFDISIEGSLWLASTIYHRNLVEDHDLISRGYIHLHPGKYNDFLQRELWINQAAPQQDSKGVTRRRGRCLFRISMEGVQDDIQFYFGRCFRSLKRTEADMVRIIVDKMSPMIRTSMSKSVLKGLLKKGGFMANLPTNMDAVTKQFNEKINLDKLKSLFSQSDQSEIPPMPEQVLSAPAINPADKKKRPGLNDAEIEDAIGTLFEYFEDTFALLKETLNDTAFRIVMSKIWKEILTVIEGLLVPALSDLPSDMKPLNDKEVYIVTRWLKGLSNFFFAGGEGVPIEDLHNARFRQLLALPLFYELSTDDLMMECNRSLNALLAATTQPLPLQGGIRRSKSVYQQRNLGTIRQRKTLKRKAGQRDASDLTEASPEMMMRILRMRPNTQDFLTQQLETLHKIQQEDASKTQPQLSRPSVKRRIATSLRLSKKSDLPFLPT